MAMAFTNIISKSRPFDTTNVSWKISNIIIKNAFSVDLDTICSSIELIIILGLGNAVSEPMLNPNETSIPQGFTVIIIAITIFKMYDYLTIRYKKFNKFIVAKSILLVTDSKI